MNITVNDTYVAAPGSSLTHSDAVLTFIAPYSRQFRHLSVPVMHSDTWEFLWLAALKESNQPQELNLESLSLEFTKTYVVGFDGSVARSSLPRLKKLALRVRCGCVAPETLPLPWGQITGLHLDSDRSIDIQTFLNLFTSLESLTIGFISAGQPLRRSFQISLPHLTTFKARVPSRIHNIQHISNLLSLIFCPSLIELTIEPLTSLEPHALITLEKSQGCDELFRGVSHMLSESGCFDTISTFDIHEIPFHYSSLHLLLEPMTGLKRLYVHRRGHTYVGNLAAPVLGLKLAASSGSSGNTDPVMLPLLEDLRIVFDEGDYNGDGARITRAEIEILRIFGSIVISRLRSQIPLESAVLEFATGSDHLPFGENDLEALRGLAREENAAVKVVWCGTNLVGSRYELGGKDSMGRRKSLRRFLPSQNGVKALALTDWPAINVSILESGRTSGLRIEPEF
ncbi:hypothetical protein V5O48_013049 [Marasmius crinis-equi]|uniref:Uncharacterized protein n=1 Tax=Marasmius crinis-equi TaxID=585013 RepID=A0ABR3F151_9AGAR